MGGPEDKNVMLCTVLKAQATVLLYDQLTKEKEDLLLAADLGIISAGWPGKRAGRGECQMALARRKKFYPKVLQYIYSTLVDNGKPILPAQI
jgi:hypothetical protein